MPNKLTAVIDVIACAIWRFANTISAISAITESESGVQPAKLFTAPPRRLTIADQWAFLSSIIKDAVSRADSAVQCHVSATLQLDLAQYGLISLVDELSAVMNVGGRAKRATVHVLGSAPVRAFEGALAA